MPDILVLDDDLDAARALSRTLVHRFDATIDVVRHPWEALKRLKSGGYKVLISSYEMPHVTGVEVLRKARRISPHTVGILLAVCTDGERVVAAVNRGETARRPTSWRDSGLHAIVRESLAVRDSGIKVHGTAARR